jgi:hypothetical protein
MHAFISYSVTEKKFGSAVKDALESIGVECFLAHQDLRVSEEWKARIIKELREVDIFVTILSAQFKASDWCGQELGFIVSRPDVLVVPLGIDHTNPYGFISHLQGQQVSDESAISKIIEDLFFRERPRYMIPIQIQRMRDAGSFRGGEAAVKPLVPLFENFTNEEARDFAAAAVGNGQVWDAALCRREYLPKFLVTSGRRIPYALKNELSKKIEDSSPSLLKEVRRKLIKRRPQL